VKDLSDYIRYSCFYFIDNRDPISKQKVFQRDLPFEFYVMPLNSDKEKRMIGVVKKKDDASRNYPNGYSMVTLCES